MERKEGGKEKEVKILKCVKCGKAKKAQFGFSKSRVLFN